MPGPEVSDDAVDILRYIRLRPEPFATAGDIEPQMSVGTKQTRNRMNDLVEDGLLNVKLVGTTKVYWLSEEGKNALSSSR